ncbi:hypothetical protein SAMN05421827_12720 [Pedobacter terrae]|uniref:Uncharacterized protein n=1 Tax=Pedobacter terrae TaxID=405671 RepID=A0A1G8CXM6_9SPHI|nr:hypothetical protein [Pedobacter terrae]SDH50182.1 hypothetical protein SAMN05421827_12720 [Pedobacter terrae]
MKKIIVILFCLVLWSCSQKKLDLKDLIVGQKPNVDLSVFTDNIKEQSGRFEMPTENGVQLVDKGEKVVYYYYAGNKKVTFDKAKIADVLETKVVTYNGLVSFISVHPDNKDAVSLLKDLLKTYSIPDSISYDTRKFTDSDRETANVLKNVLPRYVKEVADEFDNKSTQYPQQFFWSKNDILTHITIDPTNANLNMSVKIVTKRAYMDHIVQEYARPLLKEYDSPLAHLFKK